YNLALAEEAGSVLPDFQQAAWQKRLEQEHENLQAALLWLLERRQIEEALRLAAGLEDFWLLGGSVSRGRSFLEEGLGRSTERNVPVSAEVRARALRVAGSLVYNQQDTERAIAFFEESERLSRHLQDKQGMAAAVNYLGVITNHRGELAVKTTEPLSPP